MEKKFQNVEEEKLEKIAEYLKTLLEDFFSKNSRASLVFLKGDLGAGKTTFVKKLGKILGIKETIISPTFVLRKDYKNLIHVDGYRFEKEEEGKSLALDRELGEKGKIILIEWPERFVRAFRFKPDFTIVFTYLNSTQRDITIKIH